LLNSDVDFNVDTYGFFGKEIKWNKVFFVLSKLKFKFTIS